MTKLLEKNGKSFIYTNNIMYHGTDIIEEML